LMREEKNDHTMTNDKEGESWIELIDRIDSSDFSKLFRNMVLVAGLLHLRESSESALADLRTIIRETSKFSQRITRARGKHPEVAVLKSIESNLGEFSSQTDGFQKALIASELRSELELLSLSLVLSRSPSARSMVRKAKLSRRIKKLARYMKSKDKRTSEKYLLSPVEQLTRKEDEQEDRSGNGDTG
jgi:hypothetical protein